MTVWGHNYVYEMRFLNDVPMRVEIGGCKWCQIQAHKRFEGLFIIFFHFDTGKNI